MESMLDQARGILRALRGETGPHSASAADEILLFLQRLLDRFVVGGSVDSPNVHVEQNIRQWVHSLESNPDAFMRDMKSRTEVEEFLAALCSGNVPLRRRR